MNEAIVRALALPEVRARLAEQGSEPVGNTPREFAAIIKTEVERWRAVAQAAGIKAE